MEVDEVDNISTHEEAYSRHLAPSFKQKELILKELGKRICELLDSPKLIKSMGNESLKMVQKFSWEGIVADILKSFESVKN